MEILYQPKPPFGSRPLSDDRAAIRIDENTDEFGVREVERPSFLQQHLYGLAGMAWQNDAYDLFFRDCGSACGDDDVERQNFADLARLQPIARQEAFYVGAKDEPTAG